MSRKLFPILILLVVLAMLLVACGGAEPTTEEPATTEEPVEGEPVFRKSVNSAFIDNTNTGFRGKEPLDDIRRVYGIKQV